MLVAAMVAATLTGCGSSDNAKSTEAAGRIAAAGTTFKIGGIGPVTQAVLLCTVWQYSVVLRLLLTRSTQQAVSMVLRSSSISRMMKQMLRSQLTLTTPLKDWGYADADGYSYKYTMCFCSC